MQEKIKAYFAEHRQEFLDDIASLVAIESTRGEAQSGMPYGPGPTAALERAMEIAHGMGFPVKNYDNYVCAVDFNNGPAQLDILAHLDIVPVGDGWTVTTPLCALERNGRLYGRGTADDKGPAMAALYAMKAVRDLGVPLTKNVRLILGTDEESGSSDLAYYYAQEQEAPMSFSPDADFPLINIEKGSISTTFSAKFPVSTTLPRVLTVEGGTRRNVVPDRAHAVVEGLSAEQASAALEALSKETGAHFSTQALPDGTMQIECRGVGAHASTPQKGVNAITALLTLLSRLPFAACEGFRALCSALSLFPHGDCAGKSTGVAMEDELSGSLTLCLNVLHYTGTELECGIDSRSPLCATQENFVDVLRTKLSTAGLTLADCTLNPPHHVPADSPFVKTLLRCYEQYSGQPGKCLAIGGGTYVHHLKNGVAYGCSMPGTSNNMHGADEFAIIDELLLSAMIFTQAIIELCA